jgi:hypothetical protein
MTAMATDPITAWSVELDARQCPQCSAALRPDATACDRCGRTVDVAAVLPEVAAGTTFEEKAVSCAPHDVERAARAEAAEGWSLLDTTVDEAAPGMILAHFRRPARAVAPARPAVAARPEPVAAKPAAAKAPPLAQPKPVAAKRPVAPAARESAPAPGETSGPAAQFGLRQAAFAVMLVLFTLFLIDKIGIFGLFIGLAILPGLLREILGLPDPKKPGGRNRKR